MTEVPSPAGYWRRFGAAAIDVFLLFIVVGFVTDAVAPDWVDGTTDTLSNDEETALGIGTLVVFTIWFNYMAYSEWRWGRTVGKYAMDLRVLSTERGTLSWTRAVVRNLLKPLDLFLGLILIPTSERRQSLGDRTVGSVVLVSAAGPAPKGEGELTGDNAQVIASVPPPGADTPLAGSPAIGASWGPVQVLLGFLALLVGTGLLSAVIAGTIDSDLDSVGATLALQAVFSIAMVGSAYIATGVSGGFASVGSALGLGRSLRSPFGPAALAYAAYIAVAIALTLLLSPEQEDVTRELGFGEGWGADLAAFALIVIAAPITEEIFFRGFFFAGVRAKTGFWVAAVISSAIWGLFHFTGSDSWPVVLQLAIFGVILCWLYERTGSIRPTIAVHAINNAIAFAVLTSG